MMMYFRLIVLAVTALFAISPSQAESLKDDRAEPACIWCGPYIGAFTGAGFTNNVINFGGLVPDIDAAKVTYGGLIGVGTTSGRWVLGAEFDIGQYGSSIDASSRAGDTDINFKWMALLRGRAGYLIHDNVLAYTTAGLALTRLQIFEQSSGELAGDKTLTGFTVGAGLEAQFAHSWLARLDYAYAHFGRDTLTAKNNFVDQTAEVDAHLIRLIFTKRLSWH